MSATSLALLNSFEGITIFPVITLRDSLKCFQQFEWSCTLSAYWMSFSSRNCCQIGVRVGCLQLGFPLKQRNMALEGIREEEIKYEIDVRNFVYEAFMKTQVVNVLLLTGTSFTGLKRGTCSSSGDFIRKRCNSRFSLSKRAMRRSLSFSAFSSNATSSVHFWIIS